MAWTRISESSYSGSYSGQKLYCEYDIISTTGNTHIVRFQLVGYYPSGNTSYNSSSSWSFKIGSNSYSGTSAFGNSGTYTIFKTVDISYPGGSSVSVSGSHNTGVSLGTATLSAKSITLPSISTEVYSRVEKLPINNGVSDNVDWTYKFTTPSAGLTCRLVLNDPTSDAGDFFEKNDVVSEVTKINLGGATKLWKYHPNETFVVVSLRHCTMKGKTLKYIFYSDFRINISNANPSIGSYTVTDINTNTKNKTGSESKCIIGYSTLRVNITGIPTLKKDAAFSKYEIRCGNVVKILSKPTGIVDFENAPSNTVKIKIIDSRGLYTEVSKSLTSYPYTPINITDFKAARDSKDPTRVTLSWTLKGSPDSIRYQYKRSTNPSWTNGGATINGSDTSKGLTGFNSDIVYNYKLIASDAISSSESTTTLGPMGVPIVITKTNDLVIDQTYTKVKNKNGDRNNLLDYIYPVGSIYISNEPSFNPNTTWGGRWSKIEGRFLIGANTTYTIGSMGGNKELNLRALIGAVNGLTDSIGYATTGAISGHSYKYAIRGTGQSSITSVNHTTPVMDTTQKNLTTNILPPYKAVYIWERTG